MIDFLTVSFLNGYTYVKKHPELFMTLLLIVVIPLGFLFSGQQFLNVSRENQERLEREKIGIFHDVFVAVLKARSFDEGFIQHEVETLSALNPDLKAFEVGKETSEGIYLLASLDTLRRATFTENPDEFRIANARPNESLILEEIRDGIRYAKGYRLIRGEGGETYYIFTKTSLEHIDILFKTRVQIAYLWLLGILVVVLLLVLRHVRLIDYGYLYRETKRANETQDLFTNMMAHELRAPLTAVRGYASLIEEDGEVTARVKEEAEKIKDASERLLLIVSDLLDVARIRSGKLEVKKSSTNIKQVILSVVDAMDPLAGEKHITLETEGNLPGVEILIDGRRLNQVLTNLVSNAIKYTKAGTISIALEERSDRIEIRVKDTGMGISAEDQKNLFAPFHRVASEEVDRIVGTGLGMWITKQLIELMGGGIAVESIRGVGTHVVVTFKK